jgi:hypothetical protein
MMAEVITEFTLPPGSPGDSATRAYLDDLMER